MFLKIVLTKVHDLLFKKYESSFLECMDKWYVLYFIVQSINSWITYPQYIHTHWTELEWVIDYKLYYMWQKNHGFEFLWVALVAIGILQSTEQHSAGSNFPWI